MILKTAVTDNRALVVTIGGAASAYLLKPGSLPHVRQAANTAKKYLAGSFNCPHAQSIQTSLALCCSLPGADAAEEVFKKDAKRLGGQAKSKAREVGQKTKQATRKGKQMTMKGRKG